MGTGIRCGANQLDYTPLSSTNTPGEEAVELELGACLSEVGKALSWRSK